MPSNEEVFEKVKEALMDALGVDDDEVTQKRPWLAILVLNRLTFWISYSS